MIFSVGVDIVEIERVKKAILNSSFTKMVFTENEQKFLKTKAQSFAGNFAAKEAVVKAFGTGFGAISPKDVEILRNEAGKPYVVFYNAALDFIKTNKITAVHISISHDRSSAVAFAVAEV